MIKLSELFDNDVYDKAIVGYVNDIHGCKRVVYDNDKLIDIIMEMDGCELSDAIDWIDYNIPKGNDMPLVISVKAWHSAWEMFDKRYRKMMMMGDN